MIIKSMSRKTPSFGQLLEYFDRDEAGKKLPHRGRLSHNLWSQETARAESEFITNFNRKTKRKNAIALHHEVLVLPGGRQSPEQASQTLIDLAKKYLELRAPKQLVVGQIHLDTDHPHVHLMISSNEVASEKSAWLSKQQFADIQAELEAYKLEKYPEYSEQFYGKERTQQRHKPQREQQLEVRTGKPSQKQQVAQQFLAALGKAESSKGLEKHLSEVGLSLYQRSKTLGVIKLETGKKYRLKTLGVLTRYDNFLENKNRVAERRLALSAGRELQMAELDNELER